MFLLSLGVSVVERGVEETGTESLEAVSGSTEDLREEEEELLWRGGGINDRPGRVLVFTHIPSLPLSLLAVLYTALGL